MQYQPGVCNIGPAEQRKRLLLGIASLLGAVVLLAAIVAVGWPLWTTLFVMFPLYGAAMGFLQYRERFCVGFAGIGIFDVGDGTHEITDQAALDADRKRAVKLNTKSLAIAAVGTLAVYVVATLLI
ncbi:hypothetical protein [Halorubrum vacuolatum]|uniref:Uncharacterized protein n=1 Tax=Halorubrum vacuolatum TaxID=63740 RepID=A0A238VLG6_HALVU|nr:hypothetical protein [Halorubrum vacuolatum]SNR35230.1 hypothetical protein SAMN06264855_10397 [Halorubrum vacuolatum]